MEKKTKLTITLALAVLVITLSLGTAISIAPNESGAQIAAPIQQEIAAPIQPEIEEPQFGALPTKTCCATTTRGVFHSRTLATGAPEVVTIYKASPVTTEKVLVTITCTYTDALPPDSFVVVGNPPLGNQRISEGNSYTFYGQVRDSITLWRAGFASEAKGWYELKIVKQ